MKKLKALFLTIDSKIVLKLVFLKIDSLLKLERWWGGGFYTHNWAIEWQGESGR